MNKVFLGLGSNVGNRLENISKVIKAIENNEKFSNLNNSSIYETKPYGKVEQNNFLNCAVSLFTDLSVFELLNYVKRLEQKIGRQKREIWGPREIDIDILLFGDLVFEDDKIVIPHKDLLNRDFVLIPIIELDNSLIHPVSNKPIKQSLASLEERFIISKFIVKKLSSYKFN